MATFKRKFKVDGTVFYKAKLSKEEIDVLAAILGNCEDTATRKSVVCGALYDGLMNVGADDNSDDLEFYDDDMDDATTDGGFNWRD